MTILSVTEKHEGSTGTIDKSGDRTYGRTFQVVTNDPLHTVVDVGNAPGIPRLWDRYPHDVACFCEKVSPKRDKSSRIAWTVTASYTNKIEDEDEPEENPLARPWTLSWSSQTFQKVADRGVKRETVKADGTDVLPAPAGDIQGPIVNSVGDQFDPPVQIESSNWQLTAKKNVASVPTWLMDYRDALNDGQITIAGITFEKHELRINSMTIGEFSVENDVGFYPFEIQVAQKTETWLVDLLDQGTHEIKAVSVGGTATDSRIRCVDTKGQHVTEPIRLDGLGARLEPDTAPVEDSVFIRYQVYLKDRDFTALGLPT